MSDPTAPQPALLAYAPTDTTPFRLPLWLVTGLVPAAVSIPLSFTWGYSTLQVLRELATSPQRIADLPDFDFAVFCLAFGLYLALPVLVFSGLIGRAPRAAQVLSLCLLPVNLFAILSVVAMASNFVSPTPWGFGWAAWIVFFSAYLIGFGFVTRGILRHRPMIETSLLTLTTSHICYASFWLVGFWDHPPVGYYFTGASLPFYCALAFRLIRR